MQSYGDYDYTGIDTGLAAGISLGFTLLALAFAVIIYAGMWKMFQKAGKPGWAAIIPIYNVIVLAEIVGKPVGFALLAALVPCVNIVLMIWLTNLLMKSFGKEVPLWTVLALLFPIIVYPVIGFGDARYIGPTAAEAQNNPFHQFGNRDDVLRNDDRNP